MKALYKTGIAAGVAGALTLGGISIKDKASVDDYVTVDLSPAGQTLVLKEKPESALERIAGLRLGQSEAYGAERISIDEYYKRAKPADDIMPGARIGGYKNPLINTVGWGFSPGEWDEFYISNKEGKGDEINKILKADKVIDFNLFSLYMANKHKEIRTVTFVKGNKIGYIELAAKSRKYKILIPIEISTIDKIKSLW